MSITSQLADKETTAKDTYPCIKKHEYGMVVLFTDKTTGTVIMESPATNELIGYFSEDWNRYGFKLLPSGSTITLTQE